MRLVLAFILFLFIFPLQAQELPGLMDVIIDTAATYPVQKTRAIGLSYKTTRDEALSPLLFEGPGIAYFSNTRRPLQQWLLQYGYGSEAHFLLNTPASSNLSEIGLRAEFLALKELHGLQKDKWRFWIGPEAQMFLNIRLHSRNINNVAAYDWATSLGASAMASNQFTLWGRTFAISNQLQLPLLFLYARPPYAWGIPPAIYEEQEGSWKEAFAVGTLNEVLLIRNQLSLDFYLKKRRKGKLVQQKAYRLAYSWNFFQVDSPNQLQTGGHLLSFSRVLSF